MLTTVKHKAVIITLLGALFASANSEAGQRVIHVNGASMNAAQMRYLDQLNCGNTVPNGRYWLNLQSGAWGYEGGPQQGFVTDCRQARSGGSGYREDRVFERYGIDMIQNPVYQ